MTHLDDELNSERAHHDTCRAALHRMITGAQHRVRIGANVSASGADAEVLGYEFRSHARELRDLPEGPLFFGRLDFGADKHEGTVSGAGTADHAGQSYHIGRLRITEQPAAPPLVVDWRAPVSRAFYQASPRDPQGVAVRRRFGWAPWSTGASSELTGLEDEHLSPPETGNSDPTEPRISDLPAAPASGILAREIERPRLGPMRDIVATIQPGQDDLVRTHVSNSVCVQGAPGTGKTAVGLHRAAYLLYTHPERIQRGGLLVLGPNRTFLAYVAEVLPALGETGVRQSTIEDEIAAHPVRRRDDPAAALIKHDARMASVLHRALYAHVRPPVEALAVPDGTYRWRVSREDMERVVADVRAESPPYTVGRERVRDRVVRLVQLQAERRTGPKGAGWLRRIGRSRPVSALMDQVWPRVRPEEVVAGLLSDPEVLAAAAENVLSEAEQQAVRWARAPRSPRTAHWSAADMLLLDEVAGALERLEGYDHVVIDEAQDLSPMQCRAIARRSEFGSLTVLGDLAQGTSAWSAHSWATLLTHLGRPDATLAPLTVGFRVPGAIVQLANRLLDVLNVDVPPAHSLRRDGELAVTEVRDTEQAVVEAVLAASRSTGSLAVIAADADVPALRAVLTAAGVPPVAPEQLSAHLTLLPASAAKGLEYDQVIAVEPAAIAEAEPRGLHRLYVVLTRAVSRLRILHSRPLPF